MKASVQYNDFVGTCAADISDYKNLYQLLKEWGVDTERFTPVGITFFPLSSDACCLSVLCKDNEVNGNKLVKISYSKEPGYTIQEVINLFKRLEVILTTKEVMEWELEDEPVINIE